MPRLAIVSILTILGCIHHRAPVEPAAPAVFGGTFLGDAGIVTLQQHGDQVTGTAAVGEIRATLGGTVKRDGKLVGTYVLNGARGAFVAVVSPEGLNMSIDGGTAVWFERTNLAKTRRIAQLDRCR